MKPLVLVDVDGVVSPMPRSGGGNADIIPIRYAKKPRDWESRPEFMKKFTDEVHKETSKELQKLLKDRSGNWDPMMDLESIRWGAFAWDDNVTPRYYFVPDLMFPVAFQDDVIEQLSWLLFEEDVDAQWLTTWDLIPDQLRKLEETIFEVNVTKFRELPIAVRGENIKAITNSIESKIAVVNKLAQDNPQQKIVWMDDQAKGYFPPNVLVIKPEEYLGLQLHHIEKIREFLNLPVTELEEEDGF